MKSAFNFAVVNAGQRNVEVHSQLVATSTPGQFRLTGPACKALGIKPTDYVTFLHDEESGAWAVGKGFILRNSDGSAQKCSPRDAKKIAANQFDTLMEAALASGNEEFIAALTAEGIEKDEQIELLAKTLVDDKYQGSKSANPAKAIGLGAPVNFTDSHIWNELKKDLDDPKSVNRTFALDDSEVIEVELPDGYQTTVTKVMVLGESVDSAPSRRGETDTDAE